MRVHFVTGNANKLAEARAILSCEVSSTPMDLPEIQSLDPEDVVVEKARAAYARLGEPLFLEDTALQFLALGGFPGALVKWVLAALGNEGLAALLAGKEDRAIAKTCVCYYDGDPHVFSGEVSGRIVAPQGSSDFGWDPIFVPDGSAVSFAQMSAEQKNAVSMRARALRGLEAFLEESNGSLYR